MDDFAPKMADHIELKSVDELIPYSKNARTHSESQVAQIAASIIEFGFTNPVLIDGEKGIIAGHGRLMAAKKLGLKEVPVVVLDHLSETQKKLISLRTTSSQKMLDGMKKFWQANSPISKMKILTSI